MLVQNHTREHGAGAGPRALARADVSAAPDVVVPFEPTLPSIGDRGWPKVRMPRALREPLARLADRVLAAPDIEATVTASGDVAGGQARPHGKPGIAGRFRKSRAPSMRPRTSALSAALRRFLPLPRSARPGPA